MTKKTIRTRAEAKKLMWEYYRDNKEWLPGWIRDFREDIIMGLSSGLDVEKIFRDVTESDESVTVTSSANR